MKIGTCVSLSSMDDIEKRLATLGKHGFDSCQLLAWNPKIWTAENARILKALLDKLGITVSAFWCGWEGPCEWNFYTGQLTLGRVPP